MYLRNILDVIFPDSTVPEPVWEGGLEVVPIIDVERIYVEADIKEVQSTLDELRETEAHLIGRVNDYGKALDSALKDELREYKALENELAKRNGQDAPHADQKSKEEQTEEAIKEAQAREESDEGSANGGCDPRVHRLYKTYAKIYHPDKASAEDKEYFNEVFQMLNHYKMLNDYRGLKEFCKKLRKKTKAEVISHIEDLKVMLQELQAEVAVLRNKCRSLINDPLQERADDYYANPDAHVDTARRSLMLRIKGLQAKLKEEPNLVGGSL